MTTKPIDSNEVKNLIQSLDLPPKATIAERAKSPWYLKSDTKIGILYLANLGIAKAFDMLSDDYERPEGEMKDDPFWIEAEDMEIWCLALACLDLNPELPKDLLVTIEQRLTERYNKRHPKPKLV